MQFRRIHRGVGAWAVVLTLVLSSAAAAQENPRSEPVVDFTEQPELWTSGAEDWGPNEARCYTVKEKPAVGKSCVALNFTYGYEHYLAFPKWRNANWDLSAIEHLELRIKMQRGTSFHGSPTLYLRNQDGPFIRIRPANRETLLRDDNDGQWRTIQIPLRETEQWETVNWLNASLTDIDFVEISFYGCGLPGGAAHHVMVDGVRFAPQQPDYAPPNENAGDLDVLIIERTPRYERYEVLDYRPTPENKDVMVGHANNKDRKHQPDPGETVTFAARVQNKGKATLGGQYRWLLDGKEVRSGSIEELEPREEACFRFKWRWDPADHDLTFQVTPDGEDYCPVNDAVRIRTNALMLKFQVERGLIARMESKVNVLGSYSCEDWLQAQLRFMNQLFENSTYDFAPDGITQRVMVGLIEYVDDGYLVTLGHGPYKVGEFDITVDGGRGLTALDDPWHSGAGAPCFMNFIGRPDGAWLHELSHQIGIIDNYQFIVEGEANIVNGVGFNYRNRGLMGGGEVYPHTTIGMLYSVYSPSDVQGLNTTKGKRRGYFGEYLYDMPEQCSLVIMDEDGRVIPDANVAVYQTDTHRAIDDVPEHQGKTDTHGRFNLHNRKAGPFTTESGCTLHDNPFGPIHVVGFNGTLLVTVKTSDRELYGFTTVADFNVEYARGYTKEAEVPVVVRVKGDERFYLAPRPLPEFKRSVSRQ